MRESNIIITAGDKLTIDPNRGSFTKEFPTQFKANGARIGLLSFSLYHSWNNVTAEFNNLQGCSYQLDGVNYNVDFPEGFYTIEQLNAYLQYTMGVNGHYMLDAEGNEVYYLKFEQNEVYYRVTLTATPVPTELPEGWTNVGIPLTGETPQLAVDDTTEWGRLIGFSGGMYPAAPQPIRTQVNGDLVPQITRITSIFVLLPGWVNDTRFTEFGSVIATFVPDKPFGSLLTYSPQVVTTYNVIPRSYKNIEVRFYTQDYMPLKILDTSQTVITLLLEEPE